MTDTGIIRKLDALGRIVFPKELRDTFGWETGTKMQIYTEGQKVIITKYEHLAFSAVSLPRSTLRSIVFAPVAQLSA